MDILNQRGIADGVVTVGLARLQVEHAELDNEIRLLVQHPWKNFQEIRNLKKKKLALKDQIDAQGGKTLKTRRSH